jgi:predicted Zn-dependent protease
LVTRPALAGRLFFWLFTSPSSKFVNSLFTLTRRLSQGVAFFIVSITFLRAQDNALAEKSRRAHELMSDHKFEDAIPLYRDLVRAVPGNPGLLLDLGLAQEMAGHLAQAVPQFDAVLKLMPQNVPALISLATCRLELNQPKLAIAPLEKFLVVQPDDRNARGMLAGAYLSVARYREAAEQYRQLTNSDGSDEKAWYGLGKTYEALAADSFSRLEKTAPESGYVMDLIGDTQLSRQRFRSAFFFYRQAQKKVPELPGVHAGLARVYNGTQHADWASAELKSEQTARAPDCKAQPAECAFFSRNYLDAAKLASPPTASAPTLFWATKAYNQLAVEAFDRLTQLPESVQIHALKAQIFSDHKQSKEAADEWRAALKLAPDDDKLKRQLAAALFDAKDYQAAMPMLAEQLASEPDSAELNYLMGASLFRTEQAEKAMPYLEKAVKANPQSLPANAALGLALAALSRSSEAIPHLKAALPLDDDGSLHYSLAQTYRAAGDMKLAAATMQDYQKIQQQNQQVNDQLAKEAEISAPAK